MKHVWKAMLAIAALTAVGAAAAGPSDEGVVIGSMTSDSAVGKVTQSAKSGAAGHARNELNVGAVDGGKALGYVHARVHTGNITQTASSGAMGIAINAGNLGSLK